MTKTFTKENIIEIDGGYVIVDKEALLLKGDYNLRGSNEIVLNETNWTKPQLGFPKIIASIGKRIERVPLIKLPDKAEQLAKEYSELPYKNWEESAQKILLVDNARLDFIAGYKASEKKYTEADIKDAVLTGITYQRQNPKAVTEDYKEIINSYIKSLQTKVPISVTLEYEELKFGGVDSISLYRLKVTDLKTNTIIPKNVEYEKA
jgi:hypothetical protein